MQPARVRTEPSHAVRPFTFILLRGGGVLGPWGTCFPVDGAPSPPPHRAPSHPIPFLPVSLPGSQGCSPWWPCRLSGALQPRLSPQDPVMQGDPCAHPGCVETGPRGGIGTSGRKPHSGGSRWLGAAGSSAFPSAGPCSPGDGASLESGPPPATRPGHCFIYLIYRRLFWKKCVLCYCWGLGCPAEGC